MRTAGARKAIAVELEQFWKSMEGGDDKDRHARLYVLWRLKRNKKPLTKSAIFDSYEIYVESHGAVRSERRRIMDMMNFPLHQAFLWLWSRKYISEERGELVMQNSSLTQLGLLIALSIKAIAMPDALVSQIEKVKGAHWTN